MANGTCTCSGVIYGFDEDAGALDFQFKKTAARCGPHMLWQNGQHSGSHVCHAPPATRSLASSVRSLLLRRWGDGKPFWEKEQTTTKRKTYTFFYANASIAAARSSQGGVCLLLRG